MWWRYTGAHKDVETDLELVGDSILGDRVRVISMLKVRNAFRLHFVDFAALLVFDRPLLNSHLLLTADKVWLFWCG